MGVKHPWQSALQINGAEASTVMQWPVKPPSLDMLGSIPRCSTKV